MLEDSSEFDGEFEATPSEEEFDFVISDDSDETPEEITLLDPSLETGTITVQPQKSGRGWPKGRPVPRRATPVPNTAAAKNIKKPIVPKPEIPLPEVDPAQPIIEPVANSLPEPVEEEVSAMDVFNSILYGNKKDEDSLPDSDYSAEDKLIMTQTSESDNEGFEEDDDPFEQIDGDSSETTDALSLYLEVIEARKQGIFKSDSTVKPEKDESSYFRMSSEDSESLSGLDIDDIIAHGVDLKASDIHITPDEKVAYTINDEIYWSSKFPEVTMEKSNLILRTMLRNVSIEAFIVDWDHDASYVVRRGSAKDRRVRVNAQKKEDGAYITMRIIGDVIPKPEDLAIEEELLAWTKLPNGLIMMNGPTGTGKALALSSRLKTPSGYVTMNDVQVGDVLLGSDNKPCRVTYVSPIDFAPELRMVEFVTPAGESVRELCDMNHQWVVSTNISRNLFLHADFEGLKQYNHSLRVVADLYESQANEHVSLETAEAYVDFLKLHSGWNYTVENFEQLLRFMDADLSLGSERILTLLSERLHENLAYGYVSQFRVFTLAEMEIFGFDLDFAVPFLNGDFIEDLDIHSEYYFNGQARFSSIEIVSPDSSSYEPVKCISVDNEDSSYVLESGVVTHNTTTLASMLNYLQDERRIKIMTYEKPIEFIYPQNGKSLVTQREVGVDTQAFRRGLDSAMRAAPKVILIGETRNQDEVDAVLYAAETGHLAVTTMHTISAADTLNRIKGMFVGEEQVRILSLLSSLARGFANQVLLRTIDGKGRFAVREILTVDREVSRLIGEGDVEGIRNLQIARGITLEHGLAKAVFDGKCTIEEARSKTSYHFLLDDILDDLYS